MRTVLLADSSGEFMDIVEKALKKHFYVVRCEEGSELLPLTVSFKPDILVVDLMLPQTDGLALLHSIRHAGLRTKIIATTFYASDYIAANLEELDVEYLMVKPFHIDLLLARIFDLDLTEHLEGERDARRRIHELLLGLHFRPDLSGYCYTVDALAYLWKHPDASVTKEVYPAVAKKYSGTIQQIEHGIRQAIEKAWERQDVHVWKIYFPMGRNNKVEHLTNTVFLARIALALEMTWGTLENE